MNVLIVSASFYPRISPRSFRTTELVKELLKRDYKVTLCIPDYNYSYNDFVDNDNLDIIFLDKENFNKGNHKIIDDSDSVINKIKCLLRKNIGQVVKKYTYYPNFKYFFAIKKQFNQKKEFDVVISIAYPHTIHWAVNSLIRNNKLITKKWIADCGDPFMLEKVSGSKKAFYFKYFEKSFCKKADYITIPEISGKKDYYTEFQNKIVEIPQGFNFSEIKINTIFQENKTVTFAYAGNFYPGVRDPRPILNYLSNLTNINFKFIVYVSSFDLIRDFIDKLGNKLEIREFVPRNELIYSLSEMDFLINIKNGDYPANPSKLIDYSLSGRPILSINSQNIDEDLFNQFLNRNYSNKTVVDIEKYDIKTVVDKFELLFN